MATTVLTGTSPPLYYKPAGTTAAFGPTDVTVAGALLTSALTSTSKLVIPSNSALSTKPVALLLAPCPPVSQLAPSTT